MPLTSRGSSLAGNAGAALIFDVFAKGRAPDDGIRAIFPKGDSSWKIRSRATIMGTHPTGSVSIDKTARRLTVYYDNTDTLADIVAGLESAKLSPRYRGDAAATDTPEAVGWERAIGSITLSGGGFTVVSSLPPVDAANPDLIYLLKSGQDDYTGHLVEASSGVLEWRTVGNVSFVDAQPAVNDTVRGGVYVNQTSGTAWFRRDYIVTTPATLTSSIYARAAVPQFLGSAAADPSSSPANSAAAQVAEVRATLDIVLKGTTKGIRIRLSKTNDVPVRGTTGNETTFILTKSTNPSNPYFGINTVGVGDQARLTSFMRVDIDAATITLGQIKQTIERQTNYTTSEYIGGGVAADALNATNWPPDPIPATFSGGVDAVPGGLLFYYNTTSGRIKEAPYGQAWADRVNQLSILLRAAIGGINYNLDFMNPSQSDHGMDFATAVAAYDAYTFREINVSTFVYYNTTNSRVEEIDPADYVAATDTDTVSLVEVGGVTLGPEQNTFGAITAANKAAAETLRNNYAAAQAAWLALYNGDKSFYIRLVWTGNGSAIQRRNAAGNGWEDITFIISGPAGAPGTIGSASQIKIAYESNADTNAFSDSLAAKLVGVEPSSTADQSGAEIKAAYEGENDTNAFSDALKTKLEDIATAATAVSIANVLAVILSGTGVSINRATAGQITISATGGGTGTGSADGVVKTAVIDEGTQVVTLTTTLGRTVTLNLGVFITATELTAALAPYTKADGTVAFTAPVSGVAPIADAHLATKKYADDADALNAALTGATFSGAARGIEPSNAKDFVTLNYFRLHRNRVAPVPVQDDMYFGLSADNVPIAAELTISAVSGVGTIPMYSGTRHLLIARLASESDITSVVFSDDPTSDNEISAFQKWSGTLTPPAESPGTLFNIWVSNRALTNPASVDVTVT